MDTLVLRPEKELRTVWHVICIIVSAIGTLVLLLLAIANVIVFGPLLLLWLLVMLLIRVWWIPLYYDSISYAIEDDAVRGQSGVFWKRYVTVPFVKTTNIDITQGPLQRVYDIGTIHIQTAGAGGNQGIHAELRLVGIRELETVKETIRERIRTYDRGHVKPPSDESPGESTEPPVLRQILQELRAIRETLEKR